MSFNTPAQTLSPNQYIYIQRRKFPPKNRRIGYFKLFPPQNVSDTLNLITAYIFPVNGFGPLNADTDSDDNDGDEMVAAEDGVVVVVANN